MKTWNIFNTYLIRQILDTNHSVQSTIFSDVLSVLWRGTVVEHRAGEVGKSTALFSWEENLSALWGNHQALRILSEKSAIYRQLHVGNYIATPEITWEDFFYSPKLAWKALEHEICQNNDTGDTFIAAWHQRETFLTRWTQTKQQICRHWEGICHQMSLILLLKARLHGNLFLSSSTKYRKRDYTRLDERYVAKKNLSSTCPGHYHKTKEEKIYRHPGKNTSLKTSYPWWSLFSPSWNPYSNHKSCYDQQINYKHTVLGNIFKFIS
jgi:hypothetical protein